MGPCGAQTLARSEVPFAMRRISKLSTTKTAEDPRQSLVPPAVKGLTWGFVGGLIAVIFLTLAVPAACSTEPDQAPAPQARLAQ